VALVDNKWLDESREIAVTVARKVHRRYHTYFDVQDVTQELMVWVLKRQDKIKEWLDHPLESDEYKMGVRKLGKTLTRTQISTVVNLRLRSWAMRYAMSSTTHPFH